MCCYSASLFQFYGLRAPKLKMSTSGSESSGQERGYAPLPPPMASIELPADYQYYWQFLRNVFPAFEDSILERVVKCIYPWLGNKLTWLPPPLLKPPWWFWGQGSGCRRPDLAFNSVTDVGESSGDRRDVQHQCICRQRMWFLLNTFSGTTCLHTKRLVCCWN